MALTSRSTRRFGAIPRPWAVAATLAATALSAGVTTFHADGAQVQITNFGDKIAVG